MYTTQSKNTPINNLKLFGNVRVLIIAALLTALSGAVGKVFSIDVMPFARIGIENLPIVLAGIWFGPFVGAAVGFGADYFGCFLKGYPPNPVTTLGFVSIGLVSGLVSMYLFKKNKTLTIILADLAAHIVGSMIIKTIGLYYLFGGQYPITLMLMWRVPLYIGIVIVESTLIILLMKNKAFSQQLEKICNHGKLR
ncbi:MAG: folate family ECF transporter S component [Ruminococcus sp.]|nr:folate family ECF transporter S component [Ruminococcus sp.]